MTEPILLGSWVTCKGVLIRNHDYKNRTWRRWTRKSPIIGIYIGKRRYMNGSVSFGSYEDPSYFIPKTYIKVALIVEDLNRNPIPVPFDEIKLLNPKK